MKTKTIRYQLVIVESLGFEKPDIALGSIEIERYFRLDEYGFPRCSKKLPQDKLLSINLEEQEISLNIPFTEASLQEFFPGFTGWRCVEEKEMDNTPWRKP